MFWDRNSQSSNVDDRRGEVGPSGGGGGLPLYGMLALASRFGWKGIIVALLVIGGMRYGGVCTGDTPAPSTSSHATMPAPGKAGDQAELVRFVGFVLDDVQNTWRAELPGYQDTRLELFTSSIASACGTATEAVGPFYCPLDRKVYIDLAFYKELKDRFGAPGDFAQAYVIAHEVGHHVQNQRGLLGKGEVNSISIELQADCLAGAWGKSAAARGLLEPGDLDEALNAASQIGDDTIQRKTQGRVQPETWTHGSAAQRSGSFRRGFAGGVHACGID